uniref:Uncharacterized protein n=1 Tax=uncultured prokaryote TaxID=198431 RepID=A0A0H5Q4S6_9ZZZZ|nr:hypothetical protein [uncultured prokaryote]
MVNEEPMASVAIRNAGVVQGARALGIVALWAIAIAKNDGHPLGENLTLSLRSYSDYWRQSDRTSWRDLKVFRAAFPDEADPQRLALRLVRDKVVTASDDPTAATAAVSAAVAV